jgi:uncharacterized protein YaiL (DUF2058 family)
MNLSLREQLLKAGLVTDKQAKQAERSNSQQRHRQTKGDTRTPPPPEQLKSARQAQAAKLLRDAELNRKQREKAERRARAAELKQLVEQLRIPRPDSDDWFNFVDDGKIHRVAVTPELRARIMSGAIAVVRSEGHYHLVPVDSLERIRERHADAIVPPPASQTSSEPAPDDPYKDFVVPDDLTW